MLVSDQEKKREDPRVRRTRKLLNQAFSELITEKGFQSITVQDIADRAEVNRATFYAHFEDKYDMLDSFTREGFLEWLSKMVDTASCEFSSQRLSRLVTLVFEFLAAMNTHCSPADRHVEPMLQAAVQEELGKYLLAWFQRSPTRVFPLGQSLETAAMAWSWAIFGAGSQWSRGARTQPAEEVAAQLVSVLVYPLASEGEVPGQPATLARA
jgi:AcrR family transcriptional regulator